ncbi:hypothetical protein [Citricoccus alkalitolerans]|uniref:Uncharacterized protein n=1 Tax=Citricoccus alkalitolerans TaxID=246603 RepID=A0ABV8XX99_9MICC
MTVRIDIERPSESGAPWVLDTVFDDDGGGPGSVDPMLSGLAPHRARAESRGGSPELGVNPDGGGRLHLVLPFRPTFETSPPT